MTSVTPRAARRARAYVRVKGPDAVDYLQRMLSNDVPDEGSVDALLLTPKARVIAPVLVWRRGDDDFLLLTEPELGEVAARSADADALRGEVRDRARGAHVDDRLRARRTGSRTATTACPRSRCSTPSVDADGEETLERLRIEAATPRFGREIDDRVLPAEAGLEERAISFTKGCYPGQEPIARQHYRGKVNRRLRVLEVDGAAPRPRRRSCTARRRSAASRARVPGLALAYVRVEVPDDAELRVGAAAARLH